MKLIPQIEGTKRIQSKKRGIVKYNIVPVTSAATPLRAPISVEMTPDSCIQLEYGKHDSKGRQKKPDRFSHFIEPLWILFHQ